MLTTLKKHAQSIEVWGIIMMKPTYTIAIAAIFMVAAFAGIAIVGDEADAVDEEVTYSVDYKVGNITTITYTANPITLASFVEGGGENAVDASADDYSGWMGANGSTYSQGSQYTFPAGVTSATFTAQPKNVTATFPDAPAGDSPEDAPENVATIGYGTVLSIKVNADGTEGKVTVIEGAVSVDATKIVGEETLYFAGWATTKTESAVGPVVYAEGDTITLTENVTLYAVYEDDVLIPFYLNGAKIDEAGLHSLNDVSKLPTAPEMDNYTFVGWEDASGVTVYSWTVDGGYKLAVENYVFSEDSKFYAEFTPVNKTVILMIGDVTYGAPVTVLYGNTMNAPALPAGYAYWAIMTKEAVLDEEGKVIEPAVYEGFDFSKAITADMTLYAIAEEEVPDESIYATFNIEGTIYGPYKVTDRFSIPQTDREGYNFLGWTVEGGDGTKLTSAQVQNYEYTEDVTFVAVYEVAEPPAPEEPAFYETSTGQIVIVIVIFAILAFGYGVYSNAFGLKDKLFGYTIQKKEKKE